jgi:hypothetical protein
LPMEHPNLPVHDRAHAAVWCALVYVPAACSAPARPYPRGAKYLFSLTESRPLARMRTDQGEQNANCGGPTQTSGGVYSTMLQTMVRDWREKFQQPELLFGSCLLAPWKDPHDEISFAELRLAQANLTSHLPRTFIISTLDQGSPKNGAVHSPYKQAVGRRAAQGLASNASGNVASMPFMSPSFASSRAVGGGGVVEVQLAEEGCYGHEISVDNSISCPPAIGENNGRAQVTKRSLV